MSENSKIQWTDHTWSPWYGCTKVSPGCANCYAEALNHRFKGDNWGKGKPRRRAADWRKPRRWNSIAGVEAADCKPLLVFPSQCDWLDPEVPFNWFCDFLQLIHDTPNLTWQLLTKRPEQWENCMHNAVWFAQDNDRRDVESMAAQWRDGTPPQNVWVGVSVEDQPRADERIPPLLDIPAKLRFLSAEPLLGPVQFEGDYSNGLFMDPLEGLAVGSGSSIEMSGRDTERIDWVIIGGESGPGARPCNVEWIRSIKDQCAAAEVPCFVKQLGSKSVFNHTLNTGKVVEYHAPFKDPKGGDPEEWPADLRVRQMPEEVGV